MNDIFISYAGDDRAVAQEMADAFEARGWSVWWDREIPFGKPFDQVIEEELNAARCVVVLWSQLSARSRWVKTEAAAAADRDRLVPVLIEDVPIPLEFRRIQTAMLPGWRGERELPEFLRLLDSIGQMLEQPPRSSPPPAPRAAPRRSSVPTKVLWGAGAALLMLLLVMVAMKPKRDEDAPPAQVAATASKAQAPPVVERAAPVESGIDATRAKGSPAPAASASGEMAIKIGDRIEEGVPVAGAGYIQTPGAQDVYAFTAKAGQRVYFRMLEHEKNMSYIKWRLTDEDGTALFDTCLGCGDVGVQHLRKGGRYKLTVGAPDSSQVGTYRLHLLDVPPPDQFSIKIGDTIRENAPDRGAGDIESPGAHDIYTFSATPGQRVYFRMLEHDKTLSYVKWKLTDADETSIFENCLACGEVGAHTLRKGGLYKLTVGAQNVPGSGPYRAQLLNVPAPDKFSINIGDTVKEHTPARGAGDIESPGAHDIYTFNATPGQRVKFRVLEHGKDMSYIKWKLSDEDGTVLFENCLGCGEVSVQTLRKGGTYTLSVGEHREPRTGTYRFQLSNVTGG